ncbi:hypothetical protein HK407_04g07260 [Ordospora pajunii]|jgi:hypothetical protein|uniref:uncharacterized protein n=1 Tax=Ordospora pajunii TaxID=3039483 RepID=UPI0029526EBB|nr:uncharacterized protein HK407_04g07260 [Ordospora pajunii]KAH9411619.1 hypothetical protein HK407_04g07260 [Ordospora pajunii]
MRGIVYVCFALVCAVRCSRIQKILRPGAREEYWAIFGENGLELNIKLNQYSNQPVFYRVVKPNDLSEDSEDDWEEMNEAFDQKYTTHGTYRIDIDNRGDENASISVYTNVMVSDGLDNDNLAIKNLFVDIEGKLMSLYNTNMRLKTIQERNIAEAKRIRKGLYIMFVIPIIYVGIGFAKLHAMKSMFSPKKGSRI